jgi:hypothetical protein
MEEVAPMEIYTIQRPSLLPVACAPSALSAALLAAKPAPAPWAHQVQTQAELAQVLVRVDGSYGITGFVGANAVSVKPMTDSGTGAPPRGRPV